MKKLFILFGMALISLNGLAQSCDAAYPVGPWQTHYDYDLLAEIALDRETKPNPDFGNKRGCGVLTIYNNNTSKTIFEGIMTYVGKPADKNGFPMPIYFFDIVSKQGKKSQMALQKFASKEGSYGNGLEINVIKVTGELANDTILKKPLYVVGAGNGQTDVTIYTLGEKELLDELNSAVKTKYGQTPGFGNTRLFVNAHAKLDPNKYKYAKCKGSAAVVLRESGNAQSKKVGDLKPGTTLLVMDEYNGWCMLKMENGNAGYASLSAVTLTNTPVGNSTTSTSSSTTTKTTASSQRNHMEFLGLEMGGNPAQFIQALRQKGFKDGSGFSQDKTQVFLSGMVYGMQSEICVYTENNRVNSVSIINMVNSKTAAINRCNRFKKEMATTYGTGAKWKTLYEGAAELKLPYGTAKYQYGMFDSGVYELSMYIIDEGK